MRPDRVMPYLLVILFTLFIVYWVILIVEALA